MTPNGAVTLVEVGPRDGFQSVTTWIPTERKIEIIKDLHDAGIRRMEAASFVSATALPQMADAREILSATARMPGLDVQVLVPTRNQAARALDVGAQHLAFVLSVSEHHNYSNVRRKPEESLAEYAEIVAMAPKETRFRLNLATAFDCPFSGPVPEEQTLRLLDQLVEINPFAEFALCDTTGRASPFQVEMLFWRAFERFPPSDGWAFHGHDTYGLGAANSLAAWKTGVRIFDAAIAGLGGCPFAPGATGNVATEDLVWMFDGMEVPTGVALDRLIPVSEAVVDLPTAQTGGRVRDAYRARACLGEIAAPLPA
jgi:hydroxymethylglutaryl-CoA lyase